MKHTSYWQKRQSNKSYTMTDDAGSDLQLSTDCSHRRAHRHPNTASPHHTSHGGSAIGQHWSEPGNRHGDTQQLSEPSVCRLQNDRDSLNNTFPFTKPRLSQRFLNSSLREGVDAERQYSGRAVFPDRDGTWVSRFKHVLQRGSSTSQISFKPVSHDAASIAASCATGLKLSTDCSHRNQARYRSFPLNYSADGLMPNSTSVCMNQVSEFNDRSVSETESVHSDLQLSLDCSHRTHNVMPRVRTEQAASSSIEDCRTHSFDHRNNIAKEVQCLDNCDIDNVFMMSNNQLSIDSRCRTLHQRSSTLSTDGISEQHFDTRNLSTSDLQISTDCSHRNHKRRSTGLERRTISSESIVNSDQVPMTEEICARTQFQGRESYDSMPEFSASDLHLTQYHSYRSQQNFFNARNPVNRDQSLRSHSDAGLSLTLDCSHRRNSSVCLSEDSFEASSVCSDLRISGDTSHRRRSMPTNLEPRTNLSHVNTKDPSVLNIEEPFGISNLETPNVSSRVDRSGDANLKKTNVSTCNDSNHEVPSNLLNIEMDGIPGEIPQRLNQIHNTRHTISNSENVEKENSSENISNDDSSFEPNASLCAKLSSCENKDISTTNARSKLLLHRESESSTNADKLNAKEAETNRDSFDITRKRRKRFRSGSDSNLLISSKKFMMPRHQSVDRFNKSCDSAENLSSTRHDKVLRISNRDPTISTVENKITDKLDENSKESVTNIQTNQLIENVKGAKCIKDIKSVKNINDIKNGKHMKGAKHVKNANNGKKVSKIDHPVPRVSFKKRTSGKSHSRRSWPSVDKKQQLIQKLHKTIAEVDHNTGGSIPGLEASDAAELDLSRLESMMPLNTESTEHERKVKHDNFIRQKGVLYRRHDNGAIWETVVSKFVS